MISKNRKGQLGKIIVSLPILILLVIIMGAFVFLSITFSGLKAPAEQSAVSLADAKENLLLKTPVLSVSEKEPEEILVYDAITLMYEEKIKETEITSFFQSLLNEENNCYLFFDSNAIGTSNFVFGYKYTITGPEEILNYNIYEEKLLTNTIKSGEIQREIKHYLGPC